MDKLITKLAGALVANNIQGDDFVDRLHYHISSAAFLVLAAGTGYQVRVLVSGLYGIPYTYTKLFTHKPHTYYVWDLCVNGSVYVHGL